MNVDAMLIAAVLAATVAATPAEAPPRRAGMQVTATAAARILAPVAVSEGRVELPAHAEARIRTDREGRLWVDFT